MTDEREDLAALSRARARGAAARSSTRRSSPPRAAPPTCAPAPLVVPTGRRRWYFPLAAAAVIVLAVAVTVHVEREQPDVEVVGSAPCGADAAAARRRRGVAARAAGGARRDCSSTPDPKPSRGSRRAPRAAQRRDVRELHDAPATPQRRRIAAAAERLRTPQASRSRRGRRRRSATKRRRRRGGARRRRWPAPTAARGFRRSPRHRPEQWLQGIDDLKRQGKHEEADKGARGVPQALSRTTGLPRRSLRSSSGAKGSTPVQWCRIFERNSCARSERGVPKNSSFFASSTIWPRVHEDHAVRDLAREAHLVRDHHHGHAFLGELDHHVEHLVDHLRVERRGRLVEQHRDRVHRQRARDRDALLLAAGELAGELVLVRDQADAVEQLQALARAPRPRCGRAP